VGPFDEGAQATSCAELPASLEQACDLAGLATVRRLCALAQREAALGCVLEPTEVECRVCCEADPAGAPACQRECRNAFRSHEF